MANATLTRPVVTMNLANRSIGRFGLLANRVMHPLVSGRFGREIGTLTQMSNVKITPSQTGITAQTELGETSIELPLYAKLLGKAGITEIALPKGAEANQIGNIFRVATTIKSEKAKDLIGNGVNLVITGDEKQFPVRWRQYYEYLHPSAIYSGKIDYYKAASIIAKTSGILTHIGVASLLISSLTSFPSSSTTEKLAAICFAIIGPLPYSVGATVLGYLASFPITLIINQRWSIPHTIRREVGHLLGFYNVDRDALMFFAKGVGVSNKLSLSAFEALNNQGLSLNELEELSSSVSNPVIDRVNAHPAVLKIADEAIESRDINRLISLSNSPFWKVRAAVAQNPNTPEEILPPTRESKA